MSGFSHRLDVRFRDCDPLGHVNNAVYFTYLERGVPGVILAHAECAFERPARYGDTLEIRMKVTALGRTSFTYEYSIVDDQGRTVATAKTVQVMYDYSANRPVPIPEEIRDLLTS